MSVAVDSSTLIAFFNGEKSVDVTLVTEAARLGWLFLPPAVLSEVLSTPEHRKILEYLTGIPVLPILDGYWERVAALRRTLIAKKLKSRLADALICQSCLDANIPLITRDKDFRHYEKLAGLELIKWAHTHESNPANDG